MYVHKSWPERNMRNNFKISVLVFVTLVCYLAKSDAQSPGSDGLFFEDTREPATFKFGPDRGVITYTFPKDGRPKVQEDNVTIQFTTRKPDAVLLRIVSEISNDYIEIYILGGNVYAAYNLGANNHLLAVISKKVTDNVYHVVKFLREGHNASLQLDNNPIQFGYFLAHPQTFNSQSQIQIGGKLHKYGRLERPFTGILRNVIVNNLRVLDLAAEEANHTSIWGDVELVSFKSGALSGRIQQPDPLIRPGVNDDLIITGSGDLCSGDDEDECPSLAVTDNADLIIPTHEPSTNPPFTTKSPRIEAEPCDDEDCFVGSGSGDGSGSGYYESTTSAVTVSEISELPVTSRTWSNINQPKPPQLNTTIFSTTTITESSLTTAITEVTSPDTKETEVTEQLYTTDMKITEEPYSIPPTSYSPYPSTEPPEHAKPFVTLETILSISAISVVTLIIVIAIIVINKLKSKKDEKATV